MLSSAKLIKKNIATDLKKENLLLADNQGGYFCWRLKMKRELVANVTTAYNFY